MLNVHELQQLVFMQVTGELPTHTELTFDLRDPIYQHW